MGAIFDLDKFEEENPVFDPFVERVNEREIAEPLHCWGCLGVYDRASGERIGEADPNGEEVTSMHDLCSECLTVTKETLVGYE